MAQGDKILNLLNKGSIGIQDAVTAKLWRSDHSCVIKLSNARKRSTEVLGGEGTPAQSSKPNTQPRFANASSRQFTHLT